MSMDSMKAKFGMLNMFQPKLNHSIFPSHCLYILLYMYISTAYRCIVRPVPALFGIPMFTVKYIKLMFQHLCNEELPPPSPTPFGPLMPLIAGEFLYHVVGASLLMIAFKIFKSSYDWVATTS